MRRWLVNIAVLMAMALSLLWAGLWARSYWVCDSFEGMARTPKANGLERNVQWELYLDRGHVSLIYDAGDRPAETGDRSAKYWPDRVTWEQRPPQWSGVRIQAINAIGFGYVFYRWSSYQVWWPCWFVQVLLGVLPAVVLIGRWWWRRRIGPGRCRACGYDLRATPERCPECGTVATV